MYGSYIILFSVCLNDNKSWCYVINVLYGTLVEISHLGLHVLLSTLLFIAAILVSKFGIQSKKNFNTFIGKWFFWRNITVVLSKDSISSSKLLFLIKCLVSYLSYGSLFYCEFKFNFSETSPGFPHIITFLLLF